MFKVSVNIKYSVYMRWKPQKICFCHGLFENSKNRFFNTQNKTENYVKKKIINVPKLLKHVK